MREREGRHPFARLALLAGALLVASSAWAQTTTSQIRGTVRDETGVVAGATVTAADPATGFKATATTTADGTYSLAGLRPATYTITAATGSHAPATRTVQVLIGQDATVDFTLATSATYSEEVAVSAEAVTLGIETTNSEIATNVTPQQIESLPQNNRNFLQFATLAPGVSFSDDTNKAGQKFHGAGGDARQVNVFVDGLSYKNNVLQGGGFMQDSSRGNPFPLDAVQELRVLSSNYKAEYEQAASAIITAVTRSGTNDLHGGVFGLFQDKSMVTQDQFSKDRNEKKPDYSRDQYGLNLGGPIVRDRLHYFLTWERNKQDRNSTVFYGTDYRFAPENVRQYLSQYETGTLTAPFDSNLYFGKLSWQPASGQTLDVSYQRRDENEIKDFGGQRVREGASDFNDKTDAAVAKHTFTFGNALNEAALTWQVLEWNPTSLNSTTPRQNYVGILDVGGKDATQDFKQTRTGLRDDFSYFLSWHGDHQLKTGAAYNHLEYDVTKRLFDNPLFEFRSDEQWQFPYQARYGYGNPGLNFSNDQVGLYVQDDWTVFPRLTLNLGVRWDYESNMLNNDYRTPPALVAAMQNACRTYGTPVGGQSTWCLRDFLDLSRYTTDGNDRDAYFGMVQPRIGFAWDATGEGKTVVTGGWGLYYDRVILNDIFDEQYRQSWAIYNFCFSADGSPTPGCSVPSIRWDPSYLSAEGLQSLIDSGQAAGPEIWLVANDMKPPRSTQWSLGVKQQLGTWTAGLSYQNVRTYNGLAYFFGDLPPGTAFGDRWGNNVQVPGYARIFVTSTGRKWWYDGYFLTLDRPMTASTNWGFNLAYTYAKAYQNGTDNPDEGIAFGAFDYLNSQSFYKFPSSNTDKQRLVMSGTYRLPAGFQVSSIITLGSGVPFTIFDDSHDPFTVRWNEGTPPQDSFLGIGKWAYQSVDLRVQWDAPKISDRVQVSLIGEGFNLENHHNYSCLENFKPRLPNVNERFGQGNCEYNTRRFQAGARVSF